MMTDLEQCRTLKRALILELSSLVWNHNNYKKISSCLTQK